MRRALHRCLACVFVISLSSLASVVSDLDTGKRAYEQGDYKTALGIVAPLAGQGSADAQVLLATMYFKGHGVQKDLAEALKWYKAAANQDNAEGQFYVGSIYLMGIGVSRDPVEGLKWLERSANQGQSDSQVLLGMVYLTGNGAARPPHVTERQTAP